MPRCLSTVSWGWLPPIPEGVFLGCCMLAEPCHRLTHLPQTQKWRQKNEHGWKVFVWGSCPCCFLGEMVWCCYRASHCAPSPGQPQPRWLYSPAWFCAFKARSLQNYIGPAPIPTTVSHKTQNSPPEIPHRLLFKQQLSPRLARQRHQNSHPPLPRSPFWRGLMTHANKK